MHRFYLAPGSGSKSNLSLTGREAHHALRVLRVRKGEQVQVLDGQGKIFECAIAETSRDCVGLRVDEERTISPLPYQLTLAQAVPKGKLFESIIQKATELGVFLIVPLLTERVVGKFDKSDQEHKIDKWRQVGIEAIKQCGSAWLPHIEEPKTISEFLAFQSSVELPLVGSLHNNPPHPRTHFNEFARARNRAPASISIAIGPEGDFTEKELLELESAGALPITLGRLVLRTETAALYCLSIFNYELQATAGKAISPI